MFVNWIEFNLFVQHQFNFQNFNFSFTRRRIDSLDNFTAKPFQIAHTEYRFCDYVFLNHYNQLKENDLTSKKLVINNFLKRMSVRDKRYLRQTISTVNRTITVNQLNMSCTFYLEIFKLRFIFEQRIYFWVKRWVKQSLYLLIPLLQQMLF